MNWLDKAVAWVNPEAGKKRVQSRLALQMMDKSLRKYEAAASGRRTEGWVTTGASTNQDIINALPKLRERARELVKNNPYGKNGIRRIANNVVGTGILPTPIGLPEAEAEKIKQAWKLWGEKTACDFDERLNFYGLQKLVMRTVAKCGECIIRRVRTKYVKGKIPLELQVLEPDFLDSTKNEINLANGGYIMSGIEYNGKGKRVAYWLYKRHPKEFFADLTSDRVDVKDIIHVYELEDPGQVRGVPFAAPSMLRMYDFDDYEDAQLMRQKIAACFSVFITENDNLDPVSGEYEPLERVEPGIIEHLPPGKTVSFAAPPAAEGYDAYSRQVLQGIAAGMGVSYEALTGDLSNVNFSSGRMGWIEFQRNVDDWQWVMLIPTFCDKAWEWFVEAAALAGYAKPGATIEVSWTAPRREMIDPSKEVKALSELVRNGFSSWHSAVKSLGENPDEVMAQLTKDAQAFDKAGLKPACDPRYDTNRVAETPDDNDGEKDGEKEAEKAGK
jgi:lambda family phage portal protein